MNVSDIWRHDGLNGCLYVGECEERKERKEREREKRGREERERERERESAYPIEAACLLEGSDEVFFLLCQRVPCDC